LQLTLASKHGLDIVLLRMLASAVDGLRSSNLSHGLSDELHHLGSLLLQRLFCW